MNNEPIYIIFFFNNNKNNIYDFLLGNEPIYI
jgi:hypothetical protein